MLVLCNLCNLSNGLVDSPIQPSYIYFINFIN